MTKTSVLIVEDEAIVAEDLFGKLRQLGYEAAGIAAGGKEAVELTGRLRPDLVLMDIHLAGSMDGIEVAEEIQRQHDIPVIFLTAHSDADTLARAKLTMPFGYILKPFQERELATQIELAVYKHRADRQIRQERELLHVTLTSIGDAVISTDAEGRITFINHVAESLTGWNSDEARGLSVTRVFRVVDEQTGQAMDDPVARVLRKGRIVPLANHAALVTRDGRIVPIEDTAAPILDAAGGVIGAVLVFHDVTDKRRAAEALQKSEQQLKQAQEIAHLGSWELDVIRNKLTWSDEVYRIFGLDPREFDATYEAFLERVHPDDRAKVDAAYADSLTENLDTYEIQHRVIRKDTGDIRIVHEKGEHFRDDIGRVIRSVGMVQDITRRKRAEAERETAIVFLSLVNESRDIDDLIHKTAYFFQRISGCEGVGIRLRREHDYPYYETLGFTREFILLENGLCSRDGEGLPIPGSTENSVLECICGNVITGRFDPSKPFFTARGSFWTNNTTELLASTAWADRRTTTRNRCNIEDYESVALIALRVGEERLGLLQFNDKRIGRFTPEIIVGWEIMADYMAVALSRFTGEKALRESEKRYRGLFEAMNEGFALHEIILDEDGRPCDYRFLEANPAFERQTGLKISEIIGRTLLGVLPQAEAFWIERYGRVALTGEPANFEYRADSLRRHYEVSAFQTEPGRFATLFLDITERKRSEEEIRKGEERFRLLSDTAGRLLVSGNPQGLINELCRKVMEHLDCQAFFNFLLDEKEGRLRLNAFAGIPDEEALKIEWLDLGAAVCGCAAKEGTRIIAEDILHTPDSRTELVESYGIQAYACHPLMVQGKVIGTLSFGTRTRTRFSSEDLELMKNVTDQVATAMERMRLIDELKKSRDELELRVRERTAELEYKNQELQEFAFTASHDLQEPLRKVSSFGDMLKKRYGDAVGEDGKDYLDRMIGATERMRSLLKALLEYSRVTTKAEPFREVDLKDIVREVISDLEVRIDKSGAQVEVDELPVISADPTQMRQLFQNLIGNGLKFQQKGKIPMVKVSSAKNGKRNLRITIEDNGIGFDEAYAEKIFLPFQRLHGRTEYEGTGMGLSICKKIVERHGGTITARSTPGKGSRFIVTLPEGSDQEKR